MFRCAVDVAIDDVAVDATAMVAVAVDVVN